VPSYEPEVIERFAAQLERRARAVRRGFMVGGLLLGALFGSFPLTSFGKAWPIPHIFGFTTLLVGAAVGTLIGWVVGEGRAAMYRLHAQTTLCQLHSQRTTLAIWRLLQERPGDQPVSELSRAIERESEVASERRVEPESEPEPEPVLVPAARLAAPPAPRTFAADVEPAPVAEPVHVRPPAPAAAPSPVPLSEPAPASAPAETPPPVYEPLVPLSAPATSPFALPATFSTSAPPPVPAPAAATSPPPVSAPSPPPEPALTQPPEYEPASAFAGHATPSALRPADTPAPPVQPPPLSG
jgi:hypothetical protein